MHHSPATSSRPVTESPGTDAPRAQGPLTGVTVVEFAGLSPASVACMLLCSLGAEVIRIDRRTHEADDETNTLRRGRRSIVLDLKHPDGNRIARQLVAKADVVIEGYRPGVMERLGLGPNTLLAENPGLVYGRLTGWGQDGPYALLAGHDITYLALTGALHSMGPADGPPVPPVNYVADLGGGTMFLIAGILAALWERRGSGHGQIVDAAMVDAVPTLAATVLRARARAQWSDERGTNYLDGGAPWYRAYTCSDGRYIAVGALEPHFYANFIKGLELESEQLPAQWDEERWPELASIIAGTVATKSRDEWEALFSTVDACVSPVLSFTEAPSHPHVAAREAFVQSEGSWQPGVAPKFSRTQGAAPGPAPVRGADTRKVLSELNLSSGEIEELLASGASWDGSVTAGSRA